MDLSEAMSNVRAAKRGNDVGTIVVPRRCGHLRVRVPFWSPGEQLTVKSPL
jgi:hypothetical protein